MTAYTIQESPPGTFSLTINNQLIAQASDRATLERMKAGLENSNNAQRAEQNTNNNTTKDGILPR
ncbi:hypothetical protein ACTXOJ_11370 [Glutamicibacter arilaitensis]|uniref:hypothetical protein n=1 Tax=Glutamicibacter arilaitensis TaxID=256701 RepID=UPI003FD59157